MNYVDEILKSNLKRILKSGVSTKGKKVRPKWLDGEPAHTVAVTSVMNVYDISKGLPLTTLRRTNWKAAIDEVLWIWQQRSNNVNDLNSRIWDSWADESGSIGKAYGYQLNKKFMLNGKEYNQVDYVLEQLKNHSVDRGIITQMFDHEDLSKMNLRPCVHSTQWLVYGDTLYLHVTQRSQDTVTANNWNVVQYGALLMMFADVSGLKCGDLTHSIVDMHIYDRHEEIAQALIDTPTGELPTTTLAHRESFYDFTVDDFEVEDYAPDATKYKIEVAV